MPPTSLNGPVAPSTTIPTPLFYVSNRMPCSPSVFQKSSAPSTPPSFLTKQPLPHQAGPKPNFSTCQATVLAASASIFLVADNFLAETYFLQTGLDDGIFPVEAVKSCWMESEKKFSRFPNPPSSIPDMDPQPLSAAKKPPTLFYRLNLVTLSPAPRPPSFQQSPRRPVSNRLLR